MGVLFDEKFIPSKFNLQMNTFRLANTSENESIWTILQEGIERRRREGSNQWQNGYPNLQTIEYDIKEDQGYILLSENEIAVYCALVINNEPSYDNIVGKWLTDGDFVVAHRIVVAGKFIGKGMSQLLLEKIELFAKEKYIQSVKIDTNFDNYAMLHLLDKNGYTYCGEVFYNGSPRKAFEKIL